MVERFKEKFPHLAPIISELQCAVPSFHVQAHRDLCQVVYRLAYAMGFGYIAGEWVETPWSENNIAGLSTREMTAGGRHDALNDLFNFWNRVKLERLGKPTGHVLYCLLSLIPSHIGDFLVKQLERAYEAQERTTEAFANLVAMAGAIRSLEWARMDINTTAPTPTNHVEKEKAYEQSVYALDRSDSM